MTPPSLMPRADDDVFVSRSQPEPAGIRSPRRQVVVPSHRNGMANADESVPTAQPDELTARALPVVVPAARGTATMPPASVQRNGTPAPWLNMLEPTTWPALLTPNGIAPFSPGRAPTSKAVLEPVSRS